MKYLLAIVFALCSLPALACDYGQQLVVGQQLYSVPQRLKIVVPQFQMTYGNPQQLNIVTYANPQLLLRNQQVVVRNQQVVVRNQNVVVRQRGQLVEALVNRPRPVRDAIAQRLVNGPPQRIVVHQPRLNVRVHAPAANVQIGY